MRYGPIAAALAIDLIAAPAARAQAGGGETVAGRPDILDQALHWITRGIEIAGIFIIVAGALLATAVYVRRLAAGDLEGDAYHAYRSSLGRAILLGLEFLVAADIIGTVAIEPTMTSVAVLAGVVLIRTFLSFSLEVEIEGRLPWHGNRRRGS